MIPFANYRNDCKVVFYFEEVRSMGTLKILCLATLIFISNVIPAIGGGNDGVLVTKSDNGKEITLPEGKTIEIRMEQPAATGYSWEIVGLDETHLQLLSSDSKPLKKGPLAGGPVQKTWRLKAIRKGQVELKMYNYRSWEGLDKAVEKFNLKITIL